jgi:type I restriction enzyme S subunit
VSTKTITADAPHPIPASWIWARIEEITEVIRGSSPRPKGNPKYFGGNIPWIMISDITAEEGKYVSRTRDTVTEEGAKRSRYLKAGTLILSNSATVCLPKILAVDGCIHDGFVAFPSLPSEINILYLYYCFHYIRPRIINENRRGVTQVNLNTNIVKNIAIPLAPSNEQYRIVTKIEELFTKLDAGIEALKKAKMQLKQYRQSVLNHAFLGNLTEDWRKGNPQQSQDLLRQWQEIKQKMFENDCRRFLNDSRPKKLPDIEVTRTYERLPQGWVAMTIESSCTFVIDCPHSTPTFLEEGEFCIDTTCIEQSQILWDRARKVSPEEFRQRVARMPPTENDVLFSREGTIGTALLVPSGARICLGQRIMMFRFAPFVIPRYAELFLQSSWFVKRYHPLILGTNSPHLNVKDIRKLPILIPPMEEQKQIIEAVSYHLSIIENTQTMLTFALDYAEKLRQSILMAAFTGKLLAQDPDDKPAAMLLQRILTERAGKAGKQSRLIQ